MKDKIVIIGAGCFQNPLILKAKEMGFETHVFAWPEGGVGKKNADFFYPISITEKTLILEKCKKLAPKAVVTIASDLAAITVNYIANRLFLPCNSEYSSLVSSNKYEMRKAFEAVGIDTPQYYLYSDKKNFHETPHFCYPMIVKPTDRSGSRAITKLEDSSGLYAALDAALKNSFEKKAIIEEYMEGEEFSCECISFEGKHHFLQLTKKFTTGAPHFIETGHIQPAGLDRETTEKIKKNVFKALDALEIRYGASHTEFKISKDGRIRLIEIGARMGGDCIGSHLVQISTGYDFLKMVIDAACGKEPDFTKTHSQKIGAIKFILKDEDLKYLESLKRKKPEYICEISNIENRPESHIIDSSTRRGYYILQFESEEEAHRLFASK